MGVYPPNLKHTDIKMNFEAKISPNRPNSNDIQSMQQIAISDVMALVLGYTPEQFKDLNIKTYSTAAEYDAHMAKQIAESNVANSEKWSDMQDHAKGLLDENLAPNIFDGIKESLKTNLGLIRSYIRQFQINEITPTDHLVFYAFDDHENAPAFNFYQLFLINEITRSVAENRNLFSGIGGSSFMTVVLNNLKDNLKKKLAIQCFEQIISLRCTLSVIAEHGFLEWDGEEWTIDNGE